MGNAAKDRKAGLLRRGRLGSWLGQARTRQAARHDTARRPGYGEPATSSWRVCRDRTRSGNFALCRLCAGSARVTQKDPGRRVLTRARRPETSPVQWPDGRDKHRRQERCQASATRGMSSTLVPRVNTADATVERDSTSCFRPVRLLGTADIPGNRCRVALIATITNTTLHEALMCVSEPPFPRPPGGRDTSLIGGRKRRQILSRKTRKREPPWQPADTQRRRAEGGRRATKSKRRRACVRKSPVWARIAA